MIGFAPGIKGNWHVMVTVFTLGHEVTCGISSWSCLESGWLQGSATQERDLSLSLYCWQNWGSRWNLPERVSRGRKSSFQVMDIWEALTFKGYVDRNSEIKCSRRNVFNSGFNLSYSLSGLKNVPFLIVEHCSHLRNRFTVSYYL